MSTAAPGSLDLTRKRCFNHLEREAAARCTECSRFFCRECVTEHDDRVVCAACLRQLAKGRLFRRGSLAWVLRAGQCLASLLLLWFCFHLAGEFLLAAPSSFHEGTIWSINWFDKE